MPANCKILFVALQFQRVGGLEKYNLDVAKSLAKQGCQVTAVSAFTSETGYCEGVPTRGLLPRSKPLQFLYRRRLWQWILRSHLLNLKTRYDLVIAGHLHVLPQVAALAGHRKIPYWLFTFGIETWAEWDRPTQQAIAACDQIIAISRFTADSVRNRLEQAAKVEIIHPAVDMELFTPKSTRQPNLPHRILTVGRLSSTERYKGHEIVMKALPAVTHRLEQPIEYWIVGDGDDRPRLENLAKTLNLSNTVKFLGQLPLTELINVYNDCDLFVMPSGIEQRTDGTWTGEGFGIVYVEAAACGKPVIAANQGGALDIVQHGVTGLLISPTQAEVTDALYRLLSDPQLCRQMGEAGRDFVTKNFSLTVFDQRWANLITSCN